LLSEGMNGGSTVSANISMSWRWFVALGVALVALGVVAWLDVAAAAIASTIVIGASLAVAGALQILHSFVARQWRGVVLSLFCGVFYAIGGLLMMWEPVHGAAVLTLLVVTFIMAGGVLRIAISLRNRDIRAWRLVLLSGIVSIIVGSLIYASLPWSRLWVLGTLVAVELFVQGGGWLYFGLTLRMAQQALLGSGATPHSTG
jgi:uncharacterized membrane protein HdeD (DUF308 family)